MKGVSLAIEGGIEKSFAQSSESANVAERRLPLIQSVVDLEHDDGNVSETESVEDARDVGMENEYAGYGGPGFRCGRDLHRAHDFVPGCDHVGDGNDLDRGIWSAADPGVCPCLYRGFAHCGVPYSDPVPEQSIGSGCDD